MIGSVGRRVGKSTAARMFLAGNLFGPAGVGAVGAAKVAPKAARKVAGMRGAVKGRTMGAFDQHARQRLNGMPRTSGAVEWASRHPFMAAGGAYTAAFGFSQLGGPQRSTRNQNSYYLQRMRQHQQSSALTGLMGHSSGAY